ncbi:hypothetical protein DSM05_16030, partial [Pseudomonas sp. FW305-3-2-15-E-TSA4]|nr:hypothetical protein [Pseudomonas sp. FW305-3-2-15-E-TSA4]
MTGSRRARQLALVVLISSLTVSAFAADPTAADRETARTLMASGRTKRDAGDLNGALKDFAAADSLMGVPTT